MSNQISSARVNAEISADLNQVPAVLKSIPQWICWRAGEEKPNGKFDKYPVDPTSGKRHNAFDKSIWRGFDDACHLAVSKNYSGVGFVLTGEPISQAENNPPLYLIGLDIDAKSPLVSDNCTGVKEAWLKLGKPYLEISPSGTGFRMFALSRVKLKGGNCAGNELYSEKRFLTVTGVIGKGQLKDCTEQLIELHDEWFGRPAQSSVTPLPTPGILDHLLHQPTPPETPAEVEKVRDMLSYLAADCDYQDWRDVIWSVEATGWTCAEDLGREWSKTAPHRFDEAALQLVRRSFKTGGVGFGTLVFKAKDSGWKEAVKQPDADATPPRFKLLTRAEFSAALPPMQWLIRGVLPTRGLAAIYGPSGSGKSFLALDALVAIAEGRSWFKYKLKQTPVVYIALEGTSGIGQRIQAWEHKHGRQIPENFRLVLDRFALNSDADVAALANEIVKAGVAGGVVVIDTLNQAAPEADENVSKDMGRLIKNAQQLQQFIDGLVLLVHHTGKDAGRGLRGHSSLLGALDATIEVSRSKDSRQWTLPKVKDGPDGVAHAFKLEVVPLGLDQDGESISSCVVAPVSPTPASGGKKKPQGGHQQTALTIIEGLLRSSADFGRAQAPSSAPCIKESDAVAAVAAGLVVGNPKRKRERAEAAIKGLIDRGLLACASDWLWAT